MCDVAHAPKFTGESIETFAPATLKSKAEPEVVVVNFKPPIERLMDDDAKMQDAEVVEITTLAGVVTFPDRTTFPPIGELVIDNPDV